MPAKKIENVTASIKKPLLKDLKFTLIGETPLIVHRFSEKVKKQMLDKQQGKKIGKNKFREPEVEYEDAKYKMSDGSDGFPALAIKQSIVDSARFFDDLPMTFLRGAIFVVADDKETGLVKINYGREEMVEDAVRLSGGGTTDLRYRPYYYDWSIDLKLRVDAGLLTVEQVAALLYRAGISQGIGEWRVERNGQNGVFTLKE